MSIQNDGYFYNQQLRSYVLQFCAIFSGLQVRVGKSGTPTVVTPPPTTDPCPPVSQPTPTTAQDERLITVPIAYAHRDRVVASILAANTQNKPLRLPTMSAYLKGLDLALNRLHGTGQERRSAYTPVGGLVPDDMRTVYQRMPLQYDLEMELGLYASNTDQHFQMLEQILPLFEPQLNIQTSDGIFDWTRLTCVTLKSINVDSNYPIGTDRRIIQSTLNFTVNAYLDMPADVRANVIHKIFVRIGAVNTADATSFDIIADLDQQGIPYELWKDAADLDLS